MNLLKRTLLGAIASFGFVFVSEGLPVQAKPAPSQTTPTDLKLARAKPAKASDLFKQAERKLKNYPDYYTLYRVVVNIQPLRWLPKDAKISLPVRNH